MFKRYRSIWRHWLPVEIIIVLILLLAASFYALRWYNYRAQTENLREQAQGVIDYLNLAQNYAANPQAHSLSGRGQAFSGWGLYLTKGDNHGNYSFFGNLDGQTVTNASSTRILINADLGEAVKFAGFTYLRDTDQNIVLFYSVQNHQFYVDGQIATKPVVITLSQGQYSRQILVDQSGEVSLK